MTWVVMGIVGFSLMLTASVIRMEPSSERVVGGMALIGCLLCAGGLIGGMLAAISQ